LVPRNDTEIMVEKVIEKITSPQPSPSKEREYNILIDV
jgi:methylase of polypeptide subunit release factors